MKTNCKGYFIELNPDMVRRAKMLCAKHDITFTQLLRQILRRICDANPEIVTRDYINKILQ